MRAKPRGEPDADSRKPGMRDRLRYAFDNTMVGGSAAIIGWLALLSLAVIMAVALIVWLGRIGPADDKPMSLSEAAWASLMRTLDPGTMGSDAGWRFRFAMLAVTLGGIFVISTFIGVVTNSIDSKLKDLRKGRSRVVESDHIVILNWSKQIFTVLHELRLAAGQCKDVVVVLGDRDKVAMEDEIRERLGSGGRMRVVCRSGDPIEHTDLEIVSLDTARAIIVLSPDLADGDRDAQVIKTLMAIVNNPARRPAAYHIVAELRDPRHVDVARLATRDEATLVVAGDLVARIIAQTSRHPGLASVYTELLSYEGSEFYLVALPDLVGRPFSAALTAFENATAVGIQSPGEPPRLNPPSSTPIEAADRLILITDGVDGLQRQAAQPPIQAEAIATQPTSPEVPDRTLILGWNWRVPALLVQLDAYVSPGSAVTVVADVDAGGQIDGIRTQLHRLKPSFRYGNTTDRGVLDALDIASYDHVILMCYDNIVPQRADARTMVTLLHLRDIAAHCARSFSIVSEMLDVRNRRLAEIAHPDDFIVSDQMVSLILAQLAEVEELNAIFDELFDAGGMEIYFKPADDYVRLGVPVNFATVIEAARRRGETAIGFRHRDRANRENQQHSIVLNPHKSAETRLGANDRVIVIADQ